MNQKENACPPRFRLNRKRRIPKNSSLLDDISNEDNAAINDPSKCFFRDFFLICQMLISPKSCHKLLFYVC